MEEVIQTLMEIQHLLDVVEVRGQSVPALFGIMQRNEKLLQFFQNQYAEESKNNQKQEE